MRCIWAEFDIEHIQSQICHFVLVKYVIRMSYSLKFVRLGRRARMSRRTQNPFKSMYFAAQCGAAELTNGLLAAIAIKGQRKTSMLITNVEANFIKKATGLITFTCDEGNKIIETVENAIRTEEGQVITVTSIGRNEAGQVVSEIKFTWSFKVK